MQPGNIMCFIRKPLWNFPIDMWTPLTITQHHHFCNHLFSHIAQGLSELAVETAISLRPGGFFLKILDSGEDGYNPRPKALIWEICLRLTSSLRDFYLKTNNNYLFKNNILFEMFRMHQSSRLYAEKPPCHCGSSGFFWYFQLHLIVSPSTTLLLSASQFEHLVIRHLPAAHQLLDQTDHLGVALRK